MSIENNSTIEQSRNMPKGGEKSIPKGWVETALGEVINIKHGFAFKGEFISLERNENILITPGNFKVGGGFKSDKFKYYYGDIPNDYILNPNDVIVTMTDLSKIGDTLGYSAKVPTDNKNYLHNQRIGLLIYKNNDFDKEYIYWLLRTKHYQKSIVNSSTGSTVRHTSPKRIQEYSFNTPQSIEEQKAIAQILTAFDDKIELLQDQNKTLETTAQTIFKEWFGKYQIGDELPEGWRVGKLREVVKKISKGTTPRKKDLEGLKVEIPFLKVKDISNEGLILKDNLELIPKKIHQNQLKRSILETNDILFSIAGTIGRVSIVNKELNNSNCNQALAFIRLKDKNKFKEYVRLWFKSKEIQGEINNCIVQGVQANISLTVLGNLAINIPNDIKMTEWNNLSKPIYQKIETNNAQTQTLKQTRDTLLPKLMSGQLRVDEFKERAV
jgi:type I restriction enzyme S subunit